MILDKQKPYFVYILHCSDGTLYTGICVDPEKRLHAHNTLQRGAKYTRTRRPVSVVYQEICANRSEAQKREYILRTLPRLNKLQLCSQWKKVTSDHE